MVDRYKNVGFCFGHTKNYLTAKFIARFGDNLNLPLSYFIYKLTTDHSNIKNARKALTVLDGILIHQGSLYEKIKESSTFQILRSLEQMNEIVDFYRPYSVAFSTGDFGKNFPLTKVSQNEQWGESETIESTIGTYNENGVKEHLAPQIFHHLIPRKNI